MPQTINYVKDHYTGAGESNLAARVRTLLETLGPGPIPADRLANFDHFHVRAAAATADLANFSGVQAAWNVLDAGSGLGGPSRYLAQHYGCHVEGVDLTPAFVEVADLLAERAALGARLRYTVGDVTALPFEAARFDLVWCEHVAMNIAGRPQLYREFRRVLKPGGLLAFYDIVSIDGSAAPIYPLPWSETAASSFLLTHQATLDAIRVSGFTIEADRDASQEALLWFQQTLGAATPGPNLSLAMGPRMAVMARNLAQNIREGSLGLLMGVARAI
jgi:ubiquinone/menaquinone biosynthesis C-methylase UbiE